MRRSHGVLLQVLAASDALQQVQAASDAPMVVWALAIKVPEVMALELVWLLLDP